MSEATLGKYLDVDLNSGKTETKTLRAEDVERYLGGRGLGARLLYDETPAGLDPFDPRMVIIFTAGPLVGTGAPQSNRFTVTTKSPATGGIADSHCGGDFATKLRKAGYEAVLVRGRAERPVYLEITDQAVTLKDAAHLWGKGTRETQAALPKGFGMAVIGPGGENRVRYAGIVSQRRVAARGGTGAVMGSKNLKAIIADGRAAIPVADPKAFKKLQKDGTLFLKDHPMTGKVLPELGTPNLVMITAGRNILPTRNYQTGHDLRSMDLAGERIRDELFIKQDGCTSCPVKCGREVHLHEGKGKGPEFETIGMIGNNLGIFDLQAVTELGELCDDLGLDTISTGNTLAFATELTEKGRLQSELAWGRLDGYRAAIMQTARREGLGADLADGTRAMAAKYGGQEYAIHVKGLELPAYDPRGCVGQGLEYATNNRGGCHVRGSTMYMEALGPVSIDPLSTKAKPELVIFQQNLNAGISSLVMCYFASYTTVPGAAFGMNPNGWVYKLIAKALTLAGPILRLVLGTKAPIKLQWWEKFVSTVTGRNITTGEFNEIGARIYTLERLYNLREGLTGADDTLPPRLLNETTFPKHTSRGVPLAEMLPQYYKVRGWDASGVPTPETVRRLQIRT